jgi:hypothetical protein
MMQAEGKQKPAKARIRLKEKRDGKHLAQLIYMTYSE